MPLRVMMSEMNVEGPAGQGVEPHPADLVKEQLGRPRDATAAHAGVPAPPMEGQRAAGLHAARAAQHPLHGRHVPPAARTDPARRDLGSLKVF